MQKRTYFLAPERHDSFGLEGVPIPQVIGSRPLLFAQNLERP